MQVFAPSAWPGTKEPSFLMGEGFVFLGSFYRFQAFTVKRFCRAPRTKRFPEALQSWF
jgi:hypothetical protein